MRGDRAGNGGAVIVGRSRRIDGVEAARDRGGDFRMRGVDAGIDDGDEARGAGRQPVGLRQIELIHGILLHQPGRARRSNALLQGEAVVRLRRPHAAVGFERANDVGHRTRIGDPPAVEGGAGEPDAFGLQAHQAVPARQRVERLRRERGRQRDHHLIGHVAPLANGRNAAAPRRQRLLCVAGTLAGPVDGVRHSLGRIRDRTGDAPVERVVERIGERIAEWAGWCRAGRRNGKRQRRSLAVERTDAGAGNTGPNSGACSDRSKRAGAYAAADRKAKLRQRVARTQCQPQERRGREMRKGMAMRNQWCAPRSCESLSPGRNPAVSSSSLGSIL